MEKKFKTGYIVRLKSGSPDMTVKGYFTDHAGGVMNALSNSKKFEESVETTKVECLWFDGKKTKKRTLRAGFT